MGCRPLRGLFLCTPMTLGFRSAPPQALCYRRASRASTRTLPTCSSSFLCFLPRLYHKDLAGAHPRVCARRYPNRHSVILAVALVISRVVTQNILLRQVGGNLPKRRIKLRY